MYGISVRNTQQLVLCVSPRSSGRSFCLLEEVPVFWKRFVSSGRGSGLLEEALVFWKKLLSSGRSKKYGWSIFSVLLQNVSFIT